MTSEPTPAADVAELARHILATHHAYLWDEMPRLGDLVDAVIARHGAAHPELDRVGADYYALITDLTSHLTKEEQILFPAIIALGTPGAAPRFPGSLRGPITQMLREHDTALDLLRSIRLATGDYALPADVADDGAGYGAMLTRLARLDADLHEHIRQENEVLFPRVLQLEATGA